MASERSRWPCAASKRAMDTVRIGSSTKERVAALLDTEASPRGAGALPAPLDALDVRVSKTGGGGSGAMRNALPSAGPKVPAGTEEGEWYCGSAASADVDGGGGSAVDSEGGGGSPVGLT